MRRFYSPFPITGNQALLVGGEAHHLARVLRIRPGEQVTVFDGSGYEFTAQVQRITRDEVELEVVRKEKVDREAPWPICAAVAPPKGERQRWMVEKAVELGVSRLVLLRTARSVADPLPTMAQRLHRYVVEASKQCGRNRLMQIDVVSDLDGFWSQAPRSARRWIAHPLPSATKLGVLIRSTSEADSPRETWFAVGPEGGWTETEFQTACLQGWQPVQLGPTILRVETAVCMLAVAASL